MLTYNLEQRNDEPKYYYIYKKCKNNYCKRAFQEAEILFRHNCLLSHTNLEQGKKEPVI